MAKRRSKKRSSGRRRRVGAALNPNNPLVKFGSIALGYFLGDKINQPIEKMVGTKLDGKIVAGAEVGIGFMLAFRGKKTMVKSLAGGVLIGAGAKKAMAEFGIGGIGPYGRVPVLAGAYGNVPVLAGSRNMGSYTPNNSLNGYTPNMSLNGKQRVMGAVASGTV